MRLIAANPMKVAVYMYYVAATPPIRDALMRCDSSRIRSAKSRQKFTARLCVVHVHVIMSMQLASVDVEPSVRKIDKRL